MKGLMDEYAGRPDDGTSHYLAAQFAVAWAVLAAAERLGEDGLEDPDLPQDEPADAPLPKAPFERMQGELPAVLAELPRALRTEVSASVSQALAHEGFAEVVMPGGDVTKVDFSQMKPRGHYAESKLCGYFIAMKWLSMVPLPLDASAVELVRFMEKSGLIAPWKEIDTLVGAFLGRPIDVTVSHIQAVLAQEPAILEPPFRQDAADKAFRAALGTLGIRGLDNALADAQGAARPKPRLTFRLFPLRLGMDVPTLTGLTHPKVPNRGLPSAVDVLAVLGVPAAERVGLAQAQGTAWQAPYQTELAKLRQNAPGSDAPVWSDLYHGWLALLRTLATPPHAPPEARLLFSQNPAWEDRLLSAALGGYAQLKHDAVLYAFQDFSAECADEYSVVAFVEQPILPRPRGFVEPNPAFFSAAAALAKQAYAVFGGGTEPTVMNLYDSDGKEVTLNARIMAERLAKIARAQLGNLPIDPADLEFLRTIGGTFEAIFLAQQKTQGRESGKGRLERGLALVTDIHTNVTDQVALEIGIGRVDRLFVAVPDQVGARMTMGGVFGFYEFTEPIGERLTDEQWQARIVGQTLPPRPAWVKSFFETAPR